MRGPPRGAVAEIHHDLWTGCTRSGGHRGGCATRSEAARLLRRLFLPGDYPVKPTDQRARGFKLAEPANELML